LSAGARAWAPAVAWAALIFLLSARSTTAVPLEHGLDKFAHFGAYAVLGAALGRARLHHRWPLAVPLALGLLYALSDELHQAFVPGRTAEAADWVADALGTLAGLLLFHRWRRRAADSRPRPGAIANSS